MQFPLNQSKLPFQPPIKANNVCRSLSLTFLTLRALNLHNLIFRPRKYFKDQHLKRPDLFEKIGQSIRQNNYSRVTNNKLPQKTIKKVQIPKPTPTLGSESSEVPYMAKRPRNAYNLFVRSQSASIKGQFPEMRAPDIVRVAASRYGKMSDEQKRPYLQQFQNAKRIFDQQHQYGQMSFPEKRGKRGSRGNYSLH